MLNVLILSIIVAVTAFMSDMVGWNGVGDSGNRTLTETSAPSLSEYGKKIDGYNQLGGYKVTLKFSDSGAWTLEFYEKIPDYAAVVFVPASGIDFASSLVSGNSEIRPSTLSEYSLSPDSFSDPLSKLGNRNRSLTAPGPKKLEFSGFSKGDSVFVSFGSYVRYKVSGEFENARDDALSDNAVLDSNGFVNVVTDQSNVNGSFSR